MVTLMSWLSSNDREAPFVSMPLKSAAPELSDTANHVEPAFAVTTTATGELLVATAVVPGVVPSEVVVLVEARD